MRKSRNMHSFPFRRSTPPECAQEVQEATQNENTTVEIKGFKRASGFGTVRSCGKLSRQLATTQAQKPPETAIVAYEHPNQNYNSSPGRIQRISHVDQDKTNTEIVPAMYQKVKLSTKKNFNKYLSFKPASRPLLEHTHIENSKHSKARDIPLLMSGASGDSIGDQYPVANQETDNNDNNSDNSDEDILELKPKQESYHDKYNKREATNLGNKGLHNNGLHNNEHCGNNKETRDTDLNCVVEEVEESSFTFDIHKGQFVPTPLANPASVDSTLKPDARSVPRNLNTVVTKPFVCGTHGSTFMYILDTSGTLQCGEFLYDASGQMAFVGAYMTGPSELGSLSDRLVWRIVAGQSHFIALDTTGKVHAWGDNSYGQVGSSVLRQCEILPVEVIPAGIVHIAAGHHFSIALDEAGIVWSWGSNNHGQLGQCTYDDCSRPYPIQRGSLLGRQITCIAAGECHSLAVDSLGQVHAWGDNRFGQLGNHRGSVRVATPAHVSSFGSLNGRFVSRVTSGSNTSMAVDVSGSLHVWGRVNANSTLCPSGTYRDTANYWTPFITDTGIPKGQTINYIIAGSTYVTILTNTNDVYAAAIGDTRTSPIMFRKVTLAKAQYIASVGVYNWAYMPVDNESNDMTYWNLVGLQ